MPRGKARQDTDLLAMALVGYEQQKTKIDEKIKEIRNLIGGARARKSPVTGPESSDPPTPVKPRRVLSAEARKRIGIAQRRRWAEHRKTLDAAA